MKGIEKPVCFEVEYFFSIMTYDFALALNIMQNNKSHSGINYSTLRWQKVYFNNRNLDNLSTFFLSMLQQHDIC